MVEKCFFCNELLGLNEWYPFVTKEGVSVYLCEQCNTAEVENPEHRI